MSRKLKSNSRNLLHPEDEPPEKKLTSEGDIIIKKLSEKQLCKTTTLKEQLSIGKLFEKSMDLIPVTNYMKGGCTYKDVSETAKQTEDIQKLKLCDVSDSDISLFIESKQGFEFVRNKHKLLSDQVLTNKLNNVQEKLLSKQSTTTVENNLSDCKERRIRYEEAISIKPNSTETKLLKFALDNDKDYKEKLPNPMDNIKEIEEDLNNSLNSYSSCIDIKKIRKKARSLGKSLELNRILPEPPNFICSNKSLAIHSKWDQKEPDQFICLPISSADVIKKEYTCKPQKLYTIQQGQIIQISPPPVGNSVENTRIIIHKTQQEKLTIDEIRKISRFENYHLGTPSKTLFIKNLSRTVTKDDLRALFSNFAVTELISIRLMSGKMRGQAFIEFKNAEIATKGLEEVNGIIMNNKPVIIEFGKAYRT